MITLPFQVGSLPGQRDAGAGAVQQGQPECLGERGTLIGVCHNQPLARHRAFGSAEAHAHVGKEGLRTVIELVLLRCTAEPPPLSHSQPPRSGSVSQTSAFGGIANKVMAQIAETIERCDDGLRIRCVNVNQLNCFLPQSDHAFDAYTVRALHVNDLFSLAPAIPGLCPRLLDAISVLSHARKEGGPRLAHNPKPKGVETRHKGLLAVASKLAIVALSPRPYIQISWGSPKTSLGVFGAKDLREDAWRRS